jgi:hypothetical protein
MAGPSLDVGSFPPPMAGCLAGEEDVIVADDHAFHNDVEAFGAHLVPTPGSQSEHSGCMWQLYSYPFLALLCIFLSPYHSLLCT